MTTRTTTTTTTTPSTATATATSKDNDEKFSLPRDLRISSTSDYFATYTQKDLILHALSIGYGEQEHDDIDDDDELAFVYEKHNQFQAVPSFAFVLLFGASRMTKTKPDKAVSSSFSILPPFPPPMMKQTGVLPRECLVLDDNNGSSTASLEGLPLIHVEQKIRWDHHLPVPTIEGDKAASTVVLRSRFVSVQPKSIGAFVTTETQILTATPTATTTTDDENDGNSTPLLLCALESTSLILGMPQDSVRPYSSSSKRAATTSRCRRCHNECAPTFEWTYQTKPTQALLYRLSGDTNDIHVDPSTVSMLVGGEVSKPLLHGLCTLGIAVRGILKYLGQQQQQSKTSSTKPTRLLSLETRFTKPVLVGEKLKLLVWEDFFSSGTLEFQVLNDQDNVLMDHGCVRYDPWQNTKSQSML